MFIVLNSHGLDMQVHCICLPNLIIQVCLSDVVHENLIHSLDCLKCIILCRVTNDEDSKAKAVKGCQRKKNNLKKVLKYPTKPCLMDLVSKQPLERLNCLQSHVCRQTTHVVMTLDCVQIFKCVSR